MIYTSRLSIRCEHCGSTLEGQTVLYKERDRLEAKGQLLAMRARARGWLTEGDYHACATCYAEMKRDATRKRLEPARD